MASPRGGGNDTVRRQIGRLEAEVTGKIQKYPMRRQMAAELGLDE